MVTPRDAVDELLTSHAPRCAVTTKLLTVKTALVTPLPAVDPKRTIQTLKGVVTDTRTTRPNTTPAVPSSQRKQNPVMSQSLIIITRQPTRVAQERLSRKRRVPNTTNAVDRLSTSAPSSYAVKVSTITPVTSGDMVAAETKCSQRIPTSVVEIRSLKRKTGNQNVVRENCTIDQARCAVPVRSCHSRQRDTPVAATRKATMPRNNSVATVKLWTSREIENIAVTIHHTTPNHMLAVMVKWPGLAKTMGISADAVELRHTAKIKSAVVIRLLMPPSKASVATMPLTTFTISCVAEVKCSIKQLIMNYVAAILARDTTALTKFAVAVKSTLKQTRL